MYENICDQSDEMGFAKKSLATTYFPAPRGGSIIGVRGLDFRVRKGNGYGTSTIITRHLC